MMMSKRFTLLATVLLGSLGFGTGVRADLIVSIDAPGVQASTVTGAGVKTETFNGFNTGTYSSLNTAVGTVSSANGKIAVLGADIYGGAGGTSNYLALGAQSGSASPATLVTLGGAQGYFGFWWSAADVNNQLSFYSGNQLIASFNTAFVLSAINKLPNASKYFGNPNNGGDPSEPFAYMNFTGTSGTTITSVVFANSSSTGTGFESDNWTISPTAPAIIPGTIIPGAITAVPEPATIQLAAILCAISAFGHARGKRNRS